jgi:AcrR family transcriptional regulator
VLPRPGRDELGREHPDGYTLEGAPTGHTAGRRLSDIQRARILAAMVDVASARGVSGATVARVVARSGVSRRTFYELFEDREDCFLAAFDWAVERIAQVVLPAYRRPSKWRERVRAGLAALLEFLDAEPGVARLAIVETLGAGPRALERRQSVLARAIAAVDEGRALAGTRSGRGQAGTGGRGGEGPPPLTAEGLVGGAFALIHSRLADGAGTPLVELLGPLTSMIVLPYLGPAAARRELTRPGAGDRPAPAARNGGREAGADALRDLGMRLTYRTIRVLLALGALNEQGPHPSNRQVGDAAGVHDQGQISKLLARLEHLGLIENASERRARGEPNRWRLTQRGAEVREALSV